MAQHCHVGPLPPPKSPGTYLSPHFASVPGLGLRCRLPFSILMCPVRFSWPLPEVPCDSSSLCSWCPSHSEAVSVSAVGLCAYPSRSVFVSYLSSRSGAGEIYSPASVIYTASPGDRDSAVTLGFHPLFVFSLQHLRASPW